jgi:hypothetical protein
MPTDPPIWLRVRGNVAATVTATEQAILSYADRIRRLAAGGRPARPHVQPVCNRGCYEDSFLLVRALYC